MNYRTQNRRTCPACRIPRALKFFRGPKGPCENCRPVTERIISPAEQRQLEQDADARAAAFAAKVRAELGEATG